MRFSTSRGKDEDQSESAGGWAASISKVSLSSAAVEEKEDVGAEDIDPAEEAEPSPSGWVEHFAMALSRLEPLRKGDAPSLEVNRWNVESERVRTSQTP